MTLLGASAPGARLTVTTPAPRDVWRELLARDAHALIAQTPEWVDAVCASGAWEDVSRLYQRPGGPRAVLPMVRGAGPWPAAIAPRASMPRAWGMGGVVADPSADREDVAAIVSHLATEPALSTGIRPNPLQAGRWSGAHGPRVTTIPRRAHVIDLAGGSSEVWRGFRSSARGGVRKAERAGLDIECDTTGRLIPVFYELLELSVERWARQQHEPLALARWRFRRRDPLAKFEQIAAAVGDAMRLWVAWKDGSPAASMLVLLGSNASDTRGAMNKDLAAPTNANDLLQWLAIEDACRAGCRQYHLGESGTSRSLSHYKEKFGARPVDYCEYRIERLPVTRAQAVSRGLVKRALRFRDA